LGKPQDEDQARAYLRMLRSRVHEVYTGYCLAYVSQDRITTKVVRTTVHFRDMSEEEILWYVATGEPMDKAGAYALQGHGAAFVDRIDGSHTNVIGLPLSDLYSDLKTFDIKLKTL
ncbi:MAG: Maf family protein, partial [Syntrophaceae bacterium]